jgi:hypothetical protein
LSDHLGLVFEADAADVADSGVKGAEDEFSALEIDGAADEGVDDFHERGLNGFVVLKEGDVVEARVRSFDGANHALVEVAELLSAESRGAATDSSDFDVHARFVGWHLCPIEIGWIGGGGLAGTEKFGSGHTTDFFIVMS